MTETIKKMLLEPGLHWDESSRTLEEVTRDLYPFLVSRKLFSPTPEDEKILASISQDSHSGLWKSEDHEMVGYLYEELAEIVSDELPDPYWFGYENEGGGWGVWGYDAS